MSLMLKSDFLCKPRQRQNDTVPRLKGDELCEKSATKFERSCRMYPSAIQE